MAGEVVFTTSMVGYQETLTDPSYRGQIVLFTYPLIGNYGVIQGEDESRGIQAAAVLVREYTPYHSNWASERSLAAYLARERRPRRGGHRHPRPHPAPQGQGCDARRHLDLRVRSCNPQGEGQRPPLDGRPRPRLHELGPYGADPSAGLRRGALPRRRPGLRGEGFDLQGAPQPRRLCPRDARFHGARKRYWTPARTVSFYPTVRAIRRP